MYQPDAIAAFEVNGETCKITANEVDGRDYDTFNDEAKGADHALEPEVFPNASELQEETNLGRLLVSATDGDVDNNGLIEVIYTMGARSMTIWNDALDIVADTGDEFERVIAREVSGSVSIYEVKWARPSRTS